MTKENETILVRVDKKLLLEFKQKTGFKGSQGLNLFLKGVINEELSYSNGKWKSVFSIGPVYTGIENKEEEKENIGGIEEGINTIPYEEENEEEINTTSYEDMMNGDTYIFNDVEWVWYESEEDTIKRLELLYESLINIEDFNKDTCQIILQLKFGEDRKRGNAYKREPAVTVNSLYNFFKIHNRKKNYEKIDYIVKQAIKCMEGRGEMY